MIMELLQLTSFKDIAIGRMNVIVIVIIVAKLFMAITLNYQKAGKESIIRIYLHQLSASTGTILRDYFRSEGPPREQTWYDARGRDASPEICVLALTPFQQIARLGRFGTMSVRSIFSASIQGPMTSSTQARGKDLLRSATI